ncbi:hypothetical protein SRHO_G00198030 [Serrasalmus rhombeus]
MRTALGTALLICELSSLLQEGERACKRERTTRRRRRRGREGREQLSFGSKTCCTPTNGFLARASGSSYKCALWIPSN